MQYLNQLIKWIENLWILFFEVDHKNQHRDDNHIENLRWCTQGQNQRNKTSYKGHVVEYLDRLSDYAFEFPDYNGHEFYDYWFDPETNCFYFYTGAAWREINYQTNKNESKIEGKKRNRMKPKEISCIVLYMLYLYFFSYKF